MATLNTMCSIISSTENYNNQQIHFLTYTQNYSGSLAISSVQCPLHGALVTKMSLNVISTRKVRPFKGMIIYDFDYPKEYNENLSSPPLYHSFASKGS